MKKLGKKAVALLLSGNMLLGSAAASVTSVPVLASEAQNQEEEKYISDVFIAYGKTEEEAIDWLQNNGWEVIQGSCDFNAGKASSKGEDVAAVMGIKRTSDPENAITDMAVMNMHGAYDFTQYEKLIEAKNQEIEGFIDSFLPAIEEYRKNYAADEGTPGHDRALLAHDLLNKFKDGDKEDKYAENDTEELLGDLLLEDLMQEGGGEGSGDLRQIILESSSASVLAVENAIAIAADTAADTWLDRLPLITAEDMEENVGVYCPEAKDVDVAPSLLMNYYRQDYGEAADSIADQWDDIHDKMVWYEEFRDAHDLNKNENESSEEYTERESAVLEKLKEKEKNSETDSDTVEKYYALKNLYYGLYMVECVGEWGETLGDYFNPDDDSYKDEEDSAEYLDDPCLPMAIAMSEGQRSSLGVLSLYKMLMLGFATKESLAEVSDYVDEIVGGEESVSVYSGVNRAIFRGGIALTSETLQKTLQGVDPFEWEYGKLLDVLSVAETIGFFVCLFGGAGCIMRAAWVAQGSFSYKYTLGEIAFAEELRHDYEVEKARILKSKKDSLDSSTGNFVDELDELNDLDTVNQNIAKCDTSIEKLSGELKDIDAQIGYSSKRMAGKVLLCIGVALLVAAIVTEYINIGKSQEAYLNKTFTEIPRMIVNEEDLVTYVKNKDGSKKKCIEFDQFAYYEAVRCNRQEAGKLSTWQKGVSEYSSLGCGDVADLNCDHGLEWLALYTVKARKGAPILADSLTLSYGSLSESDLEKTPYILHYFNNQGKINIADRAFCYNNDPDKTSIYFYWNTDGSVKRAAQNTK